jgi:hypothetical protein
LETHGELGNDVEEAQAQRVLANTYAAGEDIEKAEKMLRDVIATAYDLDRPLLAADATRDLAFLLRRSGRGSEAREAAQAARVLYSQLGAEAEIRRLDRAFG